MPKHAADDTTRWYSFEGVPVNNKDVIAVLDTCKPAEGGLAIDIDGKQVEVMEVQEWRSRFNSLTSRFGIWCREAALCPSVPEMRAYFGDTSRCMSFSGQELIWPETFKMQVESIADGTNSDIFDRIEQQLAFEDQSGLAHLLNPSLLPPRDYILQLLGGFDAFTIITPSPFGRHAGLSPEERGHNDEVCAFGALSEKWGEEMRTQRGELLMKAVIDETCAAFVKGDCNARAPFDEHMKRLANWARPYIPPGLPDGAEGRLAAKLALATLVDNEYDLVTAVQGLTTSKRNDPAPFDRNRLEKLKAGTTSIPQV